MRELSLGQIEFVSGGDGPTPGDYAAGVYNAVCSAFAGRVGGQAACAVLSTAFGQAVDNALDAGKADFSGVTGGSSAVPGAGGSQN